MKRNTAEITFTFFFYILPAIFACVGFIMIIIHIFRNGILNSFFDIFSARTGWFFAYGATFKTVFMDHPMELGFRLISMAIVLFIGSIFFVAHLEKIQCPYCHHFFVMKRISSNEYLGSTFQNLSETTYDHHTATSVTFSGEVIVTNFTTKNERHGVEETEHYQYDIQCSLCGYVTNTDAQRIHTTWR